MKKGAWIDFSLWLAATELVGILSGCLAGGYSGSLSEFASAAILATWMGLSCDVGYSICHDGNFRIFDSTR